VARRSPEGRGANALIERHLAGWRGKFLVLILMGFSAADFVVTRSLSNADASIQVSHNPYWRHTVDEFVRGDQPAQSRASWLDWLPSWCSEQLVITVTLSVLGFAFWFLMQRGFTLRILTLAAVIVSVYLVLTGIVLASALTCLVTHSDQVASWWESASQLNHEARSGGAFWLALIKLCGLALLWTPQLALGISGFELSMIVTPLVQGDARDRSQERVGQLRNVRKLMVTATGIMAFCLPASVLVSTLLVPRAEQEAGGAAQYRVLAYLAHGGTLIDGRSSEELNPLFGAWFGTLYDLSTILILCLAGASVMVGLRDLVPRYLLRAGMELDWAHRHGIILHIFNGIILLVTLVFGASVSAQEWAYATSVLVLLLGAAVAAFLDVRRSALVPWKRHLGLASLLPVAALFLVMTAMTLFVNRTGWAIALAFVAAIVLTSLLSRWIRSTELRFAGFEFADQASRDRWEEIRRLDFQVLVPHRPGRFPLEVKEQEVRTRHRLGTDIPVIFIEAQLGDPSDFYHKPLMRISHECGLEIIRVSHCVSVSHVIAAIALEFRQVGHPPEVIFGWSHEPPIAANLNFLLFGEGNVPWMVQELVRRAEPNSELRPRILIG